MRRFLRWLKAQRATPHTQGAYLQAVRHFRAYLAIAGSCLPSELTATHLAQFRAFFTQHPGRTRTTRLTSSDLPPRKLGQWHEESTG